jgi:hypothetical protein
VIHHPPDPVAAATHMARFLELAPVMCIRDFMCGWFRGAPFEAIRRGNVEDFVAYGFYQSTWEDLSPADMATASAFVDAVQEAWGVSYAPGRTPGLSFMAHLWEPLRAVPKPLALHAAAEAGVAACRTLLWVAGFRRRSVGGFDYWVRAAGGGGKGGRDAAAAAVEKEEEAAGAASPPRLSTDSATTPPSSDDGAASGSSTPVTTTTTLTRGDSFTSLTGRSPAGSARSEPSTASPRATATTATATTRTTRSSPSASTRTSRPRPIVFIHGVGLGIFPYLGLVWQIVRSHGAARDVLLLEVPHVALGAAPRRAAAVDDVADAAVAMLAAEGHADACFAAHSYGTFCVSRACQRSPGAVASALLIDPVCLLTCHPRLLYHFVYHSPGLRALLRGGFKEALGGVRYLFSRDLTIAETFCRRFLWHELTLWPQDMPAATLVALAHGDDLVPSPLVARHLAASAPGARVLYHPTAGHGGVLLDWEWQAGLVEAMGDLLDAPHGAAGAGLAAAVVGGGSGVAAPTPAPVKAAADAGDDSAARGRQSASPTRRRRPARLIGAGTAAAAAGVAAGLPAPPQAQQQPSPSASPRRLLRRLTVKAADAHREAALGEAAATARAAARRVRIAQVMMVDA